MSTFNPRSPDPRWRSASPSPGPVIDMTATGEFIDRPARSLPPIPARIMVVALAIAILGGALAIALLAVWLVLTLIPFVIGAGLIAYGAYRLQLWSGRASLGGKRDLFRP